MPKRVDHEARRRQITDAVCRLTLRGGLSSATFREVATEAGVSVRLVQYYFGSKAGLLEATQQHVGERSIARLTKWIEASDGSPRGVLEAFLKSFAPVDDESRVAMLMYIALGAEAVVAGPDHKKSDRVTEAEMMQAMCVEQLNRGTLHQGVVPEIEASAITAMMAGLGHYIQDGTLTADQAMATIDYHLDRLFVDPSTDAERVESHRSQTKGCEP